MKRKVFPMPNYVRERIKFAMHPIGIEPYNVSEIGYMYQLNYENGLELHIGAVSAIEQRLTTLFLTLCVLRVLFKGQPQEEMISSLIATSYTDSSGDIKTNQKLDPRYESAGEVVERIVNVCGSPQAVKSDVLGANIRSYGSVENIINAYEVIHRYLSDNYDDFEKLKKYWGFLAKNVIFFQISTDVSSALKIFETINERGVGLNPMDLLKNLLFSQVSPDQFTDLKNEWKKITNPLEKNKEKPLRYLRYFLMANYPIKNKRKDAIVREDEIYDWFTNAQNSDLCNYKSKPFEFVRLIIKNVERYIDFSKGLGNDGEPNQNMESLKRLTGGAFSLHYVLLLSASSLPKYLFDIFVTHLESFLFFYIFTKTPTKDLERNFSIWADEMRHISSLEEGGEQVQAFNEFIRLHFKSNMEKKEDELKDALKRLSLHSMQQYRIRYLLARITQYVEMAFRGESERGSLEQFSKLEIEHILPNTPSAELDAAWKRKHPELSYADHKNLLGNLTLLEKPINIVAGNDFYKDKKVEYRKSGNYLTRSLVELVEVGKNTSITRINNRLSSFQDWDAMSINQRQQMLIELIFTIWNIDDVN